MNKPQPRVRWAIIFLLISGICVIGFLPGTQYKIGMSLSEVRIECGDKYSLKKLATDFLKPPTDQQRKETEVFYLYDKHDGVILYFNDYQILVRKERIKYFGVNIAKLIDSFR